MEIGLGTGFDKLISAVETWSTGDYVGFTVCLHKLAQPKGYPSKHLSSLLRVLCSNLQWLTESMANELLMSVDTPANWVSCDILVRSGVIQLLSEIAVQFSGCTPKVCEICARLLLGKDITDPSLFRLSLELSSDFVHRLVSAVPQFEPLLTDQLLNKFPGWRKPCSELLLAICNILHLLCSPSYYNCLSLASKGLVFSAIFELLVELELNPDDDAPTADVDDVAALLPDLKHERLSWSALQEFTYQILLHPSSTVDSSNKRKLELCTGLLIAHLRTVCVDRSNSVCDKGEFQLDWTVLCAIFKRMRESFAQYVLPVNTPFHYFPLVCFYTASLRGGLMVNWIEFLWDVVKSEHQDPGSRITAVSYLVALLARARMCVLDLVMELLHDMTAWCVDYVYRHRGMLMTSHSKLLLTENRVYYAVCDAVVYVLVQLHGPLLDSRYYFQSCDHLPLAQIKLSPLSPWTNMPDQLRRVFEHICMTYNLPCATVGFPTSLADQVDGNIDRLDLPLLEQIRPSRLFSLPLQSDVCRLLRPFIQPLFRDRVVGKRFTSAMLVTDATSDNPVAAQKRKRRKRVGAKPIFLGLNVDKFARIVSDH
ncbi:hypothetical protein AHF37_00877 [Paragonimus kellicotti]|nr:hypothetical protein AHF37_00877 [Paragonimus kellicotti]